jgi:archaellum component FlaC
MVPEPKLVCPLCGHDGTAATATSSLECYGFNYLEDDVVCREVQGVDEQGRLRLGDQLRAGPSPGGNPRIECRSCWQTFPLPEGLGAMMDQPVLRAPLATEPTPAGADLDEAGSGIPDASLSQLAQQIAGSLVDLLAGAIQDAQRHSESDLRDLRNQVSGLASVAEKFPALAEELAALRKQTDTFSEAERNHSFKLARLEIALKGHEEGHHRLEEELRSVSGAQEGIRTTLEAQTGILSALERVTGQLDVTLKGQQESMEQYSAASREGMSQLSDRQTVLDASLAGQSQAIDGIREGIGRLDDSHKTLESRVDRQAEVIRSLHAAASAQAVRSDELRSALQRLEELAGGSSIPPALPEGL